MAETSLQKIKAGKKVDIPAIITILVRTRMEAKETALAAKRKGCRKLPAVDVESIVMCLAGNSKCGT